MLSQFCWMCKGNNAEWQRALGSLLEGISIIPEKILPLFSLTYRRKRGILEPTGILFEEFCMSDETLALLRQSHTLHPHPDQV